MRLLQIFNTAGERAHNFCAVVETDFLGLSVLQEHTDKEFIMN